MIELRDNKKGAGINLSGRGVTRPDLASGIGSTECRQLVDECCGLDWYR